MVYFLFWLLITIIHAVDSIRFKYLIFLTHWGFIAWNGYLLVATLNITAAFSRDNWSQSTSQDCGDVSADGEGSTQIAHRFSWSQDQSPSPLSDFSRKLHWVLFLIGAEYAVVITTLYWAFYSSVGPEHNLFSVDSLNLHMINGILAVVDLWISGIPVRLSHVIYTVSFGCAYVLFTVIYYAVGGENPEGEAYIYPFLDYASHPGAAAGLAVGCAVFFVGSLHCIFFLVGTLRKAVTERLRRSCFRDGYCRFLEETQLGSSETA